MFVCPECQAENPEENKFCQNCGVVLNEQFCHECGEQIEFVEQAECQNCGASTSNPLLALVMLSSESSDTDKATQTEEDDKEKILQTKTDKVEKILAYLDENERYKLARSLDKQVEFFSSDSPPEKYQLLQVLDTRPAELSQLETIRQAQLAILEKLPDLAYLEPASGKKLLQDIGLPTPALPYLVLEEFSPLIPTLYDTWQREDGKTTLLIEDRSQLPLAQKIWQESQPPVILLLYFFKDMLTLWQPLKDWGYGASLLDIDNLHLDEDQTCSLAYLRSETIDKEITLVDLLNTWELLLPDAEKYQCLADLINRAKNDENISIEQILIQLQNIANSPLAIEEDESVVASAEEIEEIMPETENEDITQAERAELAEELDLDTDLPTVVVPLKLVSISQAGLTDIGRQRDHNEDYFAFKNQIVEEITPQAQNLTTKATYIVCDGMGGHAAGEVASAKATETLMDYFTRYWQANSELPDTETIKEAIYLANETLYQANKQNASIGIGRMGTTMVMMLVAGQKVAIAHVGDSRIYQITRNQGLIQLTQDHEVGQREINRGVEPEIAYSRRDAYQLTQALGPRDNDFIKPAINFFEVTEDSLFLLCSDGISDNDLVEEYWQQYLKPLISSQANLTTGLSELIQLSNEYNGHDNITGILVRMKLRPEKQAAN